VQKKYQAIIIWLLTGCILIYAMVVIGAITRLTGSGLSITEWKIITGTLPPLSEEAWQKEFDAYKKIPQYQLINAHFELADFKSIYFWEYLHRLMGRLIGIVFLIPFIWFWVKKKFPPDFLKKAITLFVLGAFQGFLGWFMVKSGLSEKVYVSHYRLAIHLVSAFTVFGFTFWYLLDILCLSEKNTHPAIKKTTLLLLGVVVLQIIYGAFVAGLKAGYGYPTWPKMGAEWVPDEITILEPVWKNFVEGIAGVQFIHRYLAYVVVLIVGIVFYQSKKEKASPSIQHIILALVFIVIAQFTLGVLTLVYGVPIPIAALHQTGAFALFTSTLLLLHRVR
jgi:heme a synthase